MHHLPTNSCLQNGKYKIERVLGQGGFGITYLAYQPLLDRKVCIKEFFYKDYCERNEATSHVTLGTQSCQELVHRFMNKFIKEAQTISRQKHANIIDIYDIFTENNTAYYVMEYIEGESLSEMVKRGGALPEAVAIGYIRQVAQALSYIHAKSINHLDIKPANIMIRKCDSSVVLIDFGLSKQYDSTGGQTSSTPVGISEGYAPLEQYQTGGVSSFTPQTDIYSLGATLFYLVTGTVPPSSSEVLNNGLPAFPDTVSDITIKAIHQAMQFRKNDRPLSVEVFLNLLSEAKIVSAKTSEIDNDETRVIGATRIDEQFEKEKRRKEMEKKARLAAKKSSIKKISLGVIVVVIIIIIVFWGVAYLFNSRQIIKRQAIVSRSFTVNGISFEMMLVKGGTFTMGTTKEMKEKYHTPVVPHQVTLTNNYYLGKTEVTQSLWEAVMGNNPSFHKGVDKPVESISRNDCEAFISKLNSISGLQFRLPTEAEWEFAARGGNNSSHYRYSGENDLDIVAWWKGNSAGTTHDVADKQPNELGIYDMTGNVSEYCYDYFEEYSSNAQINPIGPENGSSHVCRGANYDSGARDCPLSNRSISFDHDYYRPRFTGLRLALSE